MEVISKSPRETQKIAKDFSKDLKPGDIVALYGDLGAGKTVFIQGIAQGLKIKKKITSPTFVFIHTYSINIANQDSSFYHMDLYRGETVHDFESLGLDEIINDKNVVVVEWASKIEDRLPKKRIDVTIKAVNEYTRRITIERN